MDFILVTDRKEFPSYHPSRYIENLYIGIPEGWEVMMWILKSSLPANQILIFLKKIVVIVILQFALYFVIPKGFYWFNWSRLARLWTKSTHTIGDPLSTLMQDPVRILRAFKYISAVTNPGLNCITHYWIWAYTLSEHVHFNKVYPKNVAPCEI